MVNPSAMDSRYRDRPESNSRKNFAPLTGTLVTRVNYRVPEKKNAKRDFVEFKRARPSTDTGPAFYRLSQAIAPF